MAQGRGARVSDHIVPMPGDWVRFRSGGRLVLAVVQYVKREERFRNLYKWKVDTDAGPTDETAILEVRRAAVETE